MLSPSEKRIFWIGTFATPLLWLLFGIVSIFKLAPQWLTVVAVALALSSANLWGYIQCARGTSGTIVFDITIDSKIFFFFAFFQRGTPIDFKNGNKLLDNSNHKWSHTAATATTKVEYDQYIDLILSFFERFNRNIFASITTFCFKIGSNVVLLANLVIC